MKTMMMMHDDHNNKKMKVKKGWLTVEVGLEEEEDHGDTTRRFEIPIAYLYHPLFRSLLDKAYEFYGYHFDGPLKLPCSVDDFLHILWQIQKQPNNQYYHRNHHNYHHLPHALFFHC